MKKKMHIYCYSIKMSKQTLKFDHNVVNKKYFHASKQAIALHLVKNGFKPFIGYLYDDDVIRPLCIILLQ